MGTKYVRKTGSDGAAGTSAGAAWLTIGKALGASGMADGDTLYIGAGTYRETVTVGFTPTGTTQIIADVDGAQTGDAGDVIWTEYNGTGGDVATPAAANCCSLNSKNFLSFNGILFVGGGTGLIGGGTSHDITFTKCGFQTVSNNALSFSPAANVALNLTCDSCLFLIAGNSAQTIILTIVDPNSASDLDLNTLIKNCFFISGANPIRVAGPATNAQAGKPGGVRIRNCTILATNQCVDVTGASMSTATPCEVTNSTLYGASGLVAAATGQITEDFNHIYCTTARTSVTAGASTVTGTQHAPLVECGYSYPAGRQPRPFLSPMAGSPLLGFGGASTFTPYTVDALSRPRPSGTAYSATTAATTGTATAGAASTLTDGGASWTVNGFTGYRVKITSGTGSGQQRYIVSNTATVLTVDFAWATNPDNTSHYSVLNPGDNATSCGSHERHDSAVKQTGTVDVSPSIGQQGPFDVELQIPVNAAATTITVKVQRDGNYGAGTKPQIVLLANGEIGVTTQTVTDTAAASQWNTLSVTFTPTASGVVKLRLDATGSAGIGNTFWDTLSVN